MSLAAFIFLTLGVMGSMGTRSATSSQVNLLKKVKVNRRWQKCRLASDARNRIRWDYVLVDGKPELHREGVYVLRSCPQGKFATRSLSDRTA